MADEGIAVDLGSDLGGGEESTALVTTGETGITSVEHTEDTGGELDTTGDQSATRTDKNYRPFEGGKLSKSVSTAVALLKTDHPQLANDIPRALAFRERVRSEFPGVNPFDAMTKLKRELKAIGGPDGIAQIKSSLAQMERLDLLYVNGDPQMLEEMTAEPDGKAAFVKIAPHAFTKFRQLAPNRFTAYFARTFIQDMVGQNFDLAFRRLASLIPKDNVEAVEYVTQIQQYLDRLKGFTELTPEEIQVTEPDNGTDTARADLERERREFQYQQWRAASDGVMNRLSRQTWDTETKGREVSAADKADVEALFGIRLNQALSKVPDRNEMLQEFQRNNDKDGYVQYLAAIYQDLVQKLLRFEIQKRLGKAPVNGRQTATATAPKATAGTTAVPGFKKVANSPNPNDTLYGPNGTTRLMFNERKAVVKAGNSYNLPAGTKITW